MFQKISISNIFYSFELSIHLWILTNKNIYFSTKILGSTTVLNIDNNQKYSWAAYYYDFWRSCDTEDCSNDDENTALITEINYILKQITIENIYFKQQ